MPVSKIAFSILKRISSFLFLFCCAMTFAIGFPESAYAYLDPGTGSILLQGLAAAFIAVGMFWRRIVTFVKSLFSRGKNE